ncbi:MAG: nuclear transport factor 2 family protein [Gammaproteobacteria bacterium]|nr:nuclear transport factor 2 family protein [Gammaproteobacteria bacterium]
MMEQPDVRILERFLFHEARLLDEKRWDEWEALFVEDGEYWVPASRNQPDPHTHVSIMYEKSLLRAVRLKRYRHPNAMSLQPEPHSVHCISNVMLDSFDDDSGVCITNARFVMLEYRRNNTNIHGGAVTHTLEPHGESYLIRRKKIELVNCDGELDNIQLYF